MSTKAIELARTAVLEVADPGTVGELEKSFDLDGVFVVHFASTHPGYVGWHWACAVGGKKSTVNEVWMEPGESALVAAPWVPWSERIQPGDLGAGDVLPTDPDDPRLQPGYFGTPEEMAQVDATSPAGWAIGLGRARMLSPQGLDEAVFRWREGENGPRTQIARYAEAPCSSCGWLLPIGGGMGQAFGVCANALSPSDGRIVSMDHGCGAHSETVVETGVVPVAGLVLDEFSHDDLDMTVLSEEAASEDAGAEIVGELPAEPAAEAAVTDEAPADAIDG